MLLGFEGGQASARTLLKEGDVRFVALSWGGAEPPHDLRRRLRAAGLDRAPLAALAGPRAVPRPPVAQLPAAQRPDPQGADLRPDRRRDRRPAPRRCPRRRAATATTTTASPGSATPRSPCGGCTRSGSTGRPSTSSPSSPTSPSATTTCRSCTASAASASSPSPSSTTCPATPNSRPVRIGNAAYSQRSTTSGARCSTRSTCTPRRPTTSTTASGRSSSKQVGEALKHWREPDAGIWEVRGELRHFTSSKIMCWVAVDRGARLARMIGEDDKAAEWELAADEIKEDILANGVDERGVLTQYYGSTALDASLLLAPLVRFLPPDDPRIRATVLAIRDELTVDGLVLRYRVEETDDGFSGEEGTFTICSFWLVSALCEIGEFQQGPQAVREAAVVRRAARAVRRGDRPAQRPAPRQLPAGVHPPGADQRRPPRHRAGDRRRRSTTRAAADPPPTLMPAAWAARTDEGEIVAGSARERRHDAPARDPVGDRPRHRHARRPGADPARPHRRPDRARPRPRRRVDLHRRLHPRRAVHRHRPARAGQDGRRASSSTATSPGSPAPPST